MTEQINPVAFAQRLVRHLGDVRVSEDDVAKAKNFVRSRRDLRREPSTRKGYEYIVEALLRPTVEKFATEHLAHTSPVSHMRVCSSHFHTSTDSEKLCDERWQEFKSV